MGGGRTLLLLSLVHYSYTTDGCGLFNEGWRCGDTCVKYDCDCGGEKFDQHSGSWCCVGEGERCEGWRKLSDGNYVNATCSSGKMLGLEEACHGACNKGCHKFLACLKYKYA